MTDVHNRDSREKKIREKIQSNPDITPKNKEEIEKLEEFCEKFGCDALVGVRFDREGWLFVYPDECEETKKSIKVTRDTTGLTLSRGRGFCKQETFS